MAFYLFIAEEYIREWSTLTPSQTFKLGSINLICRPLQLHWTNRCPSGVIWSRFNTECYFLLAFGGMWWLVITNICSFQVLGCDPCPPITLNWTQTSYCYIWILGQQDCPQLYCSFNKWVKWFFSVCCDKSNHPQWPEQLFSLKWGEMK